MAPAYIPPCTPEASCTPVRCHPSLPVCSRPAACLARTTALGKRPCQSAASIMATRSKATCGYCLKFSDDNNTKKNEYIQKYLKRKSKEARLRKIDRIKGTHKYLKYRRSKGRPRAKTDCCAGKGHRGRLKPKRPLCCSWCCRCCRTGCKRCCETCCCQCCVECCRYCCTIL